MTRTAFSSPSLLLASVAALALMAGAAKAQTAVSPVTVTSERAVQAYQPEAQAPVGPLGEEVLANTPQAITIVPNDLILNLQSKTVNDTLRYLPSVQVRDQQGYEVSRPQARGFQGSVAQNTRVDGLSIVGTSATAAEMLDSVEVMNGLSGALYGPATPAGVFNYQLKRPTDRPTAQFTESYDSGSTFTEHLDAGGRFGPDNRFGLRLNVAQGDGHSWTDDSYVHRTLAGIAADYHFDSRTVVELNYVYYDTNITGLPGSIVYDGVSSKSGTSSFLPIGLDPTKAGFGQSGAGADLTTNLGSFKVEHQISDDWSFEFGGLYQDAVRNLFGITNTLTNDLGAFTVTKNFTAVPHFTIGSNEAYLNGHVLLGGLMNDVTLGTNGFINGQYNYRNSIATTLGTGNIANPPILPGKPEPATGGHYEAGVLNNQTLVLGDTLHLTPQLAVQGVVNDSFFSSKSWSNKDVLTSSNSESGAISGTVSLIYKPTDKLTGYFTYANSIEQGEQAAANNANTLQFLSPYHDVMYEGGVKYAPIPQLLVTLDGFRMTRPFAQTNPTNNVFQVIGEQRNTGVELFVQGAVTRDLSLFGGATYIDAKLYGSVLPQVNGKWVVGVPEFKADMAADYHPAVLQGVALTAAIHAESQRAATNVNNSFAPAYTTFDLGARYTLPIAGRATTLRFQVLNLSDVRYYNSIADGSIVGSPGANTAYMAPPRTYQASIEVNF
ncbi:MAG TPA: TonB-dependent siderophore receptor [Caulobacteraceae bacterium]|jgi:iron complex outermembrane receptor protein